MASSGFSSKNRGSGARDDRADQDILVCLVQNVDKDVGVNYEATETGQIGSVRDALTSPADKTLLSWGLFVRHIRSFRANGARLSRRRPPPCDPPVALTMIRLPARPGRTRAERGVRSAGRS